MTPAPTGTDPRAEAPEADEDQYTSPGARLLRAVTSKLDPVWTPENGWRDP